MSALESCNHGLISFGNFKLVSMMALDLSVTSLSLSLSLIPYPDNLLLENY